MKLKEYLDKHQIPITQMARDIGINRSHLWRIVTEKLEPGKDLAKKIVVFTGHQVSFDDLYTI